MTKQEKDKCEKLLDDVYLYLNNAEPNWDDYKKAKREKRYGNAETAYGFTKVTEVTQKGFIRH